MKIVINASTVAYGGGLTITFNFIQTFSQNKNHDFYVFLPSGQYRELPNDLNYIYVPSYLTKKGGRFFLDHLWLIRKIKKIKPDKIISLGNIPLATSYYQIYYLQNIFLVTESYSDLNLTRKDIILHKLRRFLFRKRVLYINHIISQSRYMDTLLKKSLPNLHATTDIFPNTIPKIPQQPIRFSIISGTKNKKKLLVLSRYYSHKNLEILLDVASLIRKKHKNYILITTLENKHHPKASKLIKKIKRNFTHTIVNLGEIKRENIESLYENTDALLLPTLIESFSTVYMEAMYFLKPVLTSDRPFARNICQDAGWYFDPYSAENILEIIEECFANDDVRKKKLETGQIIVRDYPSWDQIVARII